MGFSLHYSFLSLSPTTKKPYSHWKEKQFPNRDVYSILVRFGLLGGKRKEKAGLVAGWKEGMLAWCGGWGGGKSKGKKAGMHESSKL